MKYVIMFTSTPDLDAAVPPERAEEVYGRIFQWFDTNAGAIADPGAELQPVTTATTVRHGGAGPVVVDGPFSEAREVVGGFSVIEVADLDAAIAIAKSWPALDFPGSSVEIRPVADHSHMEQ